MLLKTEPINGPFQPFSRKVGPLIISSLIHVKVPCFGLISLWLLPYCSGPHIFSGVVFPAQKILLGVREFSAYIHKAHTLFFLALHFWLIFWGSIWTGPELNGY